MLGKALVLSVGLSLAAGLVFADQWDKKTILTVKETILVPGAELAPGTYVVKLVDSLSNRHIVQITNERGNHVYTTVLAIPNYRLQPTDRSAFQWWETPRGNPPAIRAWFYPGDNFGQEFAYPKGLSARIAQAARQPVPTVAAETPADLKTAPVTTVEPSGKEAPLVVTAPAPTAPPEPLRAAARPVPEPAPRPAVSEVADQAATPAPAAQELPATASHYAVYGAVGLILLAAGLALRLAASHRS